MYRIVSRGMPAYIATSNIESEGYKTNSWNVCIYIYIYIYLVFIYIWISGIPRLTFFTFYIHLQGFIFLQYIFVTWNWRSPFHAVHNISCISFYKRPYDGSQLVPKHVAVNKLIKTGVECDWFSTDTCDFLTPTRMYNLNITEEGGRTVL